MNLQDLERITYRRLGKGNPTSPDSETQTRIRQFINERHRKLLRKFPHLRDDVMTFASVNGTQRYALPEQGVARINRIWETTNDRKMEMKSLTWLRTQDPDPQSSTPWAWIPLSYTQVHTNPSDASEVFVDSTAAGDTGTCFVEGIITGGYRRTASVTMTGTTAVSLSTSITNWIQIDKFYLSAAAVGIVTLHEDVSGGTELSRIAIGDTYAKFISFLLYPTPSAAITYTVDITRGIGEMSNANDEPLLPIDFHDLLSVGARLDEYEKGDDLGRRRIAEKEWDEGEKELTSWITCHPDYRPSLHREPRGISTLGAYFPSDVMVD